MRTYKRFSFAFLLVAFLAAPVRGDIPFDPKDHDWFTLAEYWKLNYSDPDRLAFILEAMYEAVYYAQSPEGQPVRCSTPIPLSDRLQEMVGEEIKTPSNPTKRAYSQNDHVAYILIHALKREGKCR
ncbi:MAG: hypothetical protein RIB59_00795 [Rhodospirillales bacterium]